jgi:RNA polymerase sigma-70 factor (ECF subfamily)
MEIDEDAITLLRAASGQSDAVSACIDRFSPLVWQLARKLLRNSSLAEDAVQDVFIELWKAAPKFDPSVASARAFVAMIARRRIIDRGRSEQRHLVASSSEFEEHLMDGKAPRQSVDDEAREMVEAVGRLSPEQQQAIRLSIGQGWSHQEIADRMGMPVGTVKAHLRRGVQRLREYVQAAAQKGAPA